MAKGPPPSPPWLKKKRGPPPPPPRKKRVPPPPMPPRASEALFTVKWMRACTKKGLGLRHACRLNMTFEDVAQDLMTTLLKFRRDWIEVNPGREMDAKLCRHAIGWRFNKLIRATQTVGRRAIANGDLLGVSIGLRPQHSTDGVVMRTWSPDVGLNKITPSVEIEESNLEDSYRAALYLLRSELPPDHFALLWTRCAEGMTAKAIAAATGRDLPSVLIDIREAKRSALDLLASADLVDIDTVSDTAATEF